MLFFLQKKECYMTATFQCTTSLQEQFLRYLPGGVSSPIRSGYMIDVCPPIISHGIGDMLVDVEGKEYLDFCLSWGALLHGHAQERVIAAAVDAVCSGSSFGASTVFELELAKRICAAMPSMEQIRFVSTGTEATMSAVRLARAYTGRENIIKAIGCYHGHADQFLIQAGSGVQGLQEASSAGVPSSFVRHTSCVPYNDIEALEELLSTKTYAAFIVEPVCANMGVVLPQEGYLEAVQALCRKNKTLLIFDEVVTGFRVGYSGAQGRFGIEPDITCLGKIIGGGFPAAAFGGRQEIMQLLSPQGGVYQAGTLSGNPVAMRAGIATLVLAEKEHFYTELEKKASLLLDPIEKYVRTKNFPASVQRVGSMWTIFFTSKKVRKAEDLPKKHSLYRDFYIRMLEKGIYLPPAQNESCFISSAHTEEHLFYAKNCIIDYFEQKMDA